jgi:RNA 2',3'-cyclic 3'-phosphodiesterase
MRLFVAVDLSEDARQAIAAEQKRIATALGDARAHLKWVRAGHLHLTLAFLGEVEGPRVPLVGDAIGRAVDAPPFDVTFAGAGVFPPHRAPRALWIGVGAGASELTALRQEIVRRIAPLGVPIDDRPFSPHLTLGRWRTSRASDGRRALAAVRQAAIARARVAGATLYHSQLSSEGPTYTALARATLTRRQA